MIACMAVACLRDCCWHMSMSLMMMCRARNDDLMLWAAARCATHQGQLSTRKVLTTVGAGRRAAGHRRQLLHRDAVQPECDRCRVRCRSSCYLISSTADRLAAPILLMHAGAALPHASSQSRMLHMMLHFMCALLCGVCRRSRCGAQRFFPHLKLVAAKNTSAHFACSEKVFQGPSKNTDCEEAAASCRLHIEHTWPFSFT